MSVMVLKKKINDEREIDNKDKLNGKDTNDKNLVLLQKVLDKKNPFYQKKVLKVLKNKKFL